MSRTHLALLGILFVMLSLPGVAVQAQGTQPEPITPGNAADVVQLQRIEPGLISAFAWSPDGETLAIAGSSGVSLYEAADPEAEPRLMEGPEAFTRSVSFSPDGQALAAIAGFGFDDTLRLWNTATGAVLATLDGHTSDISSVAFSPDGRTLASGSNDETVRLWDATTGQARATLEGHTDSVGSVAFSPDGLMLASGSSDHDVRLWDAATGAALATLELHPRAVESVAFSLDGLTLASGGEEGSVTLWAVGDGTAAFRARLIGPRNSALLPLGFSPDGTTLASWSFNHSILLWDATSATSRGLGVLIATLEGHTEDLNGAAFSPDGRVLASASDDNTVRLWNVATGEALAILEGHTSNVRSVAFRPDGRVLASAGADDNTLLLWGVGAPGDDDARAATPEAIPPTQEVIPPPTGKGGEITAGVPVTVQLDGSGAVDLQYAAPAANMTISVTARSVNTARSPGGAVDTTLEILDSARTSLGFNDDHMTDDPDLAALDSALEDVVLPQAGSYTIRVDSFSGVAVGPVEVTLTEAGATAETTTRPPKDASAEVINGSVVENGRFQQTVDFQAGELVTIRVRGLEGFDPRLALFDANQVLLIENDDHGTNDSTLSRFDSKIENYPIATGGTHTLEVTGFGGSGGSFELSVSRTVAGPAQVEVVNGNVVANGRFQQSFDFNAGEIVTLTVRDTSGTLDPVVELLDASLVTMAENDDHGTGDRTLDRFDSRIQGFTVPATGTYTVEVRDLSRGAGSFELTIERRAT